MCAAAVVLEYDPVGLVIRLQQRCANKAFSRFVNLDADLATRKDLQKVHPRAGQAEAQTTQVQALLGAEAQKANESRQPRRLQVPL